MTIPCANCGSAIAADEYRCPICDALAPVDETAVVPNEADGSAGAQTATVPWAIPMREGPRDSAPPAGRTRIPLRPAIYGVLAVAVLAGLVAVVAGVLGGDGDNETASDAAPALTGEAVADEEERGEGLTTTSADRSTTTTTTSSTSSTTTTSTSTPPTATTTVPRPTPTVASAAPARPGSVPVLASSFGGGWIAQLTSVPASTGEGAIESAWSEARRDAPGAVVARSDDWSSLEPGYWVVVAPGPFADVDDARAYCASVPDTARTDCLPRQLTGRR